MDAAGAAVLSDLDDNFMSKTKETLRAHLGGKSLVKPCGSSQLAAGR